MSIFKLMSFIIMKTNGPSFVQKGVSSRYVRYAVIFIPGKALVNFLSEKCKILWEVGMVSIICVPEKLVNFGTFTIFMPLHAIGRVRGIKCLLHQSFCPYIIPSFRHSVPQYLSGLFSNLAIVQTISLKE